MARFLGMNRRVVNNRARFRFGAAGSKHSKLLFSASIFAREAKQFKQKGALSCVGGVLTQIDCERLFGFAHLSCSE